MGQPGPADLDGLIAEITVDCYDEVEVMTAFEAAFDDVSWPCPGEVIGERVEVLSVAVAGQRRELIATCRRAGSRYELALLDVQVHGGEATSLLMAAYRRWACL